MAELAENAPVNSFLPSIKNYEVQKPVLFRVALEKQKLEILLLSAQSYVFLIN